MKSFWLFRDEVNDRGLCQVKGYFSSKSGPSDQSLKALVSITRPKTSQWPKNRRVEGWPEGSDLWHREGLDAQVTVREQGLEQARGCLLRTVSEVVVVDKLNLDVLPLGLDCGEDFDCILVGPVCRAIVPFSGEVIPTINTSVGIVLVLDGDGPCFSNETRDAPICAGSSDVLDAGFNDDEGCGFDVVGFLDVFHNRFD